MFGDDSIGKLAFLAGCHKRKLVNDPDGDGWIIDDNTLALFAELIVQKCADRVAGMVMMDKGYIPQDPHSQGWNSAVSYASRELKKHFGAE